MGHLLRVGFTSIDSGLGGTHGINNEPVSLQVGLDPQCLWKMLQADAQ